MRLTDLLRAPFARTPTPPPARVVCVHPRFAGYSSHHYNESAGLIREYRRRGLPFRLLVNYQAPPSVIAELAAEAVIDDPTFRLEWSFEERSARFVALLREHVEPGLQPHDRVLLTVATQLEAHALARWLHGLPPARRPWVVVLFTSDRWNRKGPVERARQLLEFQQLRAELASLPSECARRLLLFTLTEELSQELQDLLGVPVPSAPMPLEYRQTAHPAWTPDSGRAPVVALLGGNRREKGSHLVPGIVRACKARGLAVSFLVQLVNNSLDAAEMAMLVEVASEPNVLALPEALPMEDYQRALDGADFALFPYEVVPYRQRTSGVFGEAVAYGKPVLATRGTWMAQLIESGRAAGLVFETLEPDTIAHALAECLAELPALQHRARALAAAWREDNGIPGFVTLVEAQIAARQAAANR